MSDFISCIKTHSTSYTVPGWQHGRHNGNYPNGNTALWTVRTTNNPNNWYALILIITTIDHSDHHYIHSAADAWDDPVRAYRTCCTPDGDVTFACKAYWSGGSVAAEVTQTCQSADEFMTGCSGLYV